jgi:hypothetical protein
MTGPCGALGIAVIGFALVVACSGSPTEPSGPPTPLTVSLQSALWQTISTPSPYPLETNQGTSLVFEFPSVGSMHYLYTASTLAVIRGTLVVSLRVTATGPVVFNSLDPNTSCSIPASVRPFFWANANGNGSYDRWWSNPRSFPLADGSATLSVPLLPEFWSSVNGRFGNADSETRYAFAKALLNVTRLGLTFGGGCSFGHGVNVNGGRAEFALTGYGIR